MRLARPLLLAAIRGYKRHVSPHKGFACAYRVHEGCASCSTLGLRAISRYGAWRGLGVLRLRLEQCHLVAEEQRERRARRITAPIAQAGFIDCDVPCDASCVDFSACGGDACSLTNACEIASCLDCGDCDWGSSSRSSAASPSGCGWFSSRPPESRQVRRRRRRGEPTVWEPGPDVAPPRAE